jgi:hypothetical protein
MLTKAHPIAQQNPPCTPLTKGGKDLHAFQKLLQNHHLVRFAPLVKGGRDHRAGLAPHIQGDKTRFIRSIRSKIRFSIRFSKKERT